MKNLAFFYSAGTAGYVKGEQIADYLGAKKNPVVVGDDDVCIYVKSAPEGKIPKHTFIDVDDATRAIEWLKKHPECGVIVTSEVARRFVEKELQRNDIHVIPHAHCNYERLERPDREVKVIGIIGSKTSFQYPIEDFRKKLADIGMELRYEADYWKTYRNTPEKPGRLKVCEFYMGMDIQVMYRPRMFATPLKNANKLVNAGSFRIPTIGYPEEGFGSEWEDAYIPAMTIDDMIEEIKTLAEDKELYAEYADRASGIAEKNHISHIAKLYQLL